MPCITFLSFRAKSRNLLLAVRAVIRDVSTALDMTKNAHRTSYFSFYGDRRYRLLLFIRRTRGRFRLHRGDDLVRSVDRNHPANRTGTEHPGCADRVFQFWRAGHFSWKLFWPFALLSVPAAY